MKISVFLEHIFDAVQQENLSFSEILREIKSFGITGLEVDYGRIAGDPGLPDIIKSEGFEIACVYAFFDFPHDTSVDYPKTVIENLKGHGIKRLMAIPGFIEDGENAEKALADMYFCMNELSELAEKAGIAFCLEDFDDEKAAFSTTKGLKGFLDNVKGLSCAFDTGNFIYSGENETDSFRELRPKISHLHCKDRSITVCQKEEPKITLKNTPLYSSPVGYGVIAIEPIVKALIKSGYDGWFAIEHFGSSQQLYDMKKSAAKLKEWYNDTCNGLE